MMTWAGLGTGGRRARQIGMKLVRIKESHSGSSSSSFTIHIVAAEHIYISTHLQHPPCSRGMVESCRWCLATRCRPSVPGVTPAHLSRPRPSPPPPPPAGGGGARPTRPARPRENWRSSDLGRGTSVGLIVR